MISNTTAQERKQSAREQPVAKLVLLLVIFTTSLGLGACDRLFNSNKNNSLNSQPASSNPAQPNPAQSSPGSGKTSKSDQLKAADAAFDSEDYEKAVQLYQAAIAAGKSKGDELVYLYARLGLSYDSLDRFDEAIAAYQKALEIDPKAHEVWVNLGVAYRLKGNYDQAITSYQKALAINPNYAEAHSSLGTLYILQGKPQEAVGKFETAIKLDPTLAVAHGNLALAYAMVDRFEDADAALRQSIVLGYKNAETIRERIEQLKQK